MSQKHWGTKEDVLRDLEEVYGMRVSKIHRDVFVQGEGPPPLMISEDDQQQPCNERLHDFIAPPDLKGIAQMLQIVKEHERDDNDEIETNGLADQRECVITISKLNPNVPSFVPATDRTVSNGLSKNTDLNLNKCNNLKVENSALVKDIKRTEKIVSENTTISNKNDLKFVDNKEREELAKQLKNKISSSAKEDTFLSKREKNIAITSLLKLYSKPASPQLKINEPPKLITPDYFEKSKSEIPTPLNLDEKIDNDCNIKVINPRDLKETVPDVIPSAVSNDVSNVEIEQSINKVNNWLNPTAPKPKPSIHLGPIAFKRKEPAGCKSPNSNSDKTLSKSSTSTITEFKPTKYADELAKKFSDRQKEVEAAEFQAMDPMTKLELELKARDKIIRQRALEKRAAKANRE